MKRSAWVIAFFLCLTADLVAVANGFRFLEEASKPLLMPLLIGWLIQACRYASVRADRWVISALFLSGAGDVLLLFQQQRSLFFMLGLSAFLLAHVCYIVFFHRLRLQERIVSSFWLLGPVVLFYAGLMFWLGPHLGDMSVPVRIYGIVISYMLLQALHMRALSTGSDRAAGGWMIAGALLFVLSDSLLALNKFYRPFPGAGIAIMLTYGLAQFGIVTGVLKYLSGRRGQLPAG
ncbi:MAG: hypothetical protein RJA57_1615 [Bacteroidota bacterium]|jgi:uncharacterized membrane protein YhhN